MQTMTKEQLLSKKSEIEQRLRKISADRRKLLEPDLAEQALQIENDDVLAELERVELSELEKISRTLSLMS